MLKSARLVYLGIDVQKAFGREAKSANLATLASQPEGDESIEVLNNARLASAVYQAGGTVIVTKDWHNPVGTRIAIEGRTVVDNRAADEFAIYGEHATPADGDSNLNAPLETALQQLEAKDGRRRTVIPVDRYEKVESGDSQRIFEVHKNVYDITQVEELRDGVEKGPLVPNQAFWNLMKRESSQGPVTLILGGKIAEVCVRAGAFSLLDGLPGVDMVIPEDAVSSLPSDLARQLHLPTKPEVMSQLRERGARVVKTEEVLGWLLPA
ncbi:MAG: isochorismatase family protein [Candidatus Eremiobacteraeota bacterium]|nr:isochorismatase family protein [Candidatus Eremiobacteraeota bacterium]MCW5869261.1 isochorismatase family protein [Candidatus Eremiobacteraeota bacterium]